MSEQDNNSPINAQRAWQRNLERDRMTNIATAKKPQFPEPGAEDTEENDDDKEDDEGDEAQEDENQEEQEKESGASAQELLKLAQELEPTIKTRIMLWSNIPTLWLPLPLIALPFHKLVTDPKIKSAIRKVQGFVAKLPPGVPIDPRIKLALKLAPLLPAVEWLAVIILIVLLVALVLLCIILIYYVACANGFLGISCQIDLAKSAFSFITSTSP